MRKMYFFLTIALTLLWAAAIYPKTIVVDNKNKLAKDSNPGTSELPLLTIQKGINLAQAGDTVLVMPGIYSEHLVIKRSGNQKSGYIVLKSVKKFAAVIDGSNIPYDKLIYWHGDSDGGTNKNFIIFDGFEVTNAKKWAFWIQGDCNVLENSKIHETGGTAVELVTGSHNKFINNEIYNTGWNGISWEANNSGSGIRTDSNLVQGNFIHNLKYHVAVNGFPNEGAGNALEFGGQGNMIFSNIIKDCLEGIYLRYEKGFVIAGNLLTNINKDGIFLHFDDSYKGPYEAKGMIVNNTIANTGYNGIANSNAMNLQIINNIFYDYGDSIKTHLFYAFAIYWYAKTYSDSNYMNANLYYNDKGNQNLVYLYDGSKTLSELRELGYEKRGLQTNPEFVNAGDGDYSLKASSPAVDAGMNLNFMDGLKDINSAIRPQGKSIDIGAYELSTRQ
jgi:parallel beta-helix repeat protein